ncbi:hypothetical protein [Clostridium sp. WB02_MRS01]|uniref:hypothetical protein n=1 Tax=Clostridium sp. WB02_MRS01 TaxID=2605777 RepID=UPI0012B37AD2|nr:hypothetical protein [Clostridium sp. WB02_MRS01]
MEDWLRYTIFRYKGIEKEALAQVKKAGLEGRVIYSSFHHPSIVKVKKLNPKRLDRK